MVDVDRRAVLKGLTLAGSGLLAGSTLDSRPVKADPAPSPPFDVPSVFCLRITDIVAVPGDPGNDRFRFEFEVLNWANTEAFGLLLFQNVGAGAVTGGTPPTITGALVDTNGRPFLTGDDDGQFPTADGTTGSKTGRVNT